MKWNFLPNLLTISRILFIVPVCYFLLDFNFLPALYFLIIAGLSDGLDGYLARRFQWQTRLGSLLDPAADKLMVVCCFTALAWIQAIPLWLFVIIILKDITVVTGAVIYHYLIGAYEFSATLISKLNTFLQIVFLVISVAKLHFTNIPQVLVSILMYGMLVTTVVSLLNYVFVWSRKAYINTHKPHA
jgi:cardiolipin synthase